METVGIVSGERFSPETPLIPYPLRSAAKISVGKSLRPGIALSITRSLARSLHGRSLARSPVDALQKLEEPYSMLGEVLKVDCDHLQGALKDAEHDPGYLVGDVLLRRGMPKN